MVHMAKADLIRARREELRQLVRALAALRTAPSCSRCGSFLDQREEAALRGETVALRDGAGAERRHAAADRSAGRVADDEAMYLDYVEVWARASLEMELLCAGYGIRYLHFLQPNQYLPGSKTLTDEERARRYDPDVADTQRVATRVSDAHRARPRPARRRASSSST